MNASAPVVERATRANPVLWLVWLVPAATVVAGLATLGIALRSGDRALPASYHWEGEALERDFARLRVAATHDMEIQLAVRNQSCQATVLRAPHAANALLLTLTSTTDAGHDRAVRLARGAAGVYAGRCEIPAGGRWLLALEDDARSWIIRARVDAALERVTLHARNPDGPAP